MRHQRRPEQDSADQMAQTHDSRASRPPRWRRTLRAANATLWSSPPGRTRSGLSTSSERSPSPTTCRPAAGPFVCAWDGRPRSSSRPMGDIWVRSTPPWMWGLSQGTSGWNLPGTLLSAAAEDALSRSSCASVTPATRTTRRSSALGPARSSLKHPAYFADARGLRGNAAPDEGLMNPSSVEGGRLD